MKYLYPLFFFSIIILHNSCYSQGNNSSREITNRKKQPITESTTIKKVESEPQKKPKDFDPYFTGSQDTIQTTGPKSITRNILQDRKGNIWFATWEGIIKYDGTTFTNFTNQDSLRRHRVFTILEDLRGNLWFGTIGSGIYFYDGKTFTNYTTKDGLVNDKVLCLYEDKKGFIWIGTEKGISRYDGKDFKNYNIEEGSFINNDINAIVEDNKGTFWIGTRGRAYNFDGENFTSIKNNEGNNFNNVRTIIKDSNGMMWLGGDGGLNEFNNNTFTNHSKEFVGYIYEDKKGYIWTSSTANKNMQTWVLTRYEILLHPFLKITPSVIEPEVGMLFGIMEDRNDDIWFGYLGGACRYDGISFEYFKE